jgi:hypothetical protein
MNKPLSVFVNGSLPGGQVRVSRPPHRRCAGACARFRNEIVTGRAGSLDDPSGNPVELVRAHLRPPSPESWDAPPTHPLVSPRWATTGVFLVNGAAIGTWVAQIPWIQERFDLSEGAMGLVIAGMSLAVV